MRKQHYDQQTDRERILEHIVCEFASTLAITASFGSRGSGLGLISQMVERAPSSQDNNIVTYQDLRPGDLLCCRSVRDGVGVGFFVRLHEKDGLYLLPIGFDKPVWVANESFKRIMYRGDMHASPIQPVPQGTFLVKDQRVLYEKIKKALRPTPYEHKYCWLEFPEEPTVVWVCIRQKWKGWEESGYKIPLRVEHPRRITIKALRDQLKAGGYGDDKQFTPQQPFCPNLQRVAK